MKNLATPWGDTYDHLIMNRIYQGRVSRVQTLQARALQEPAGPRTARKSAEGEWQTVESGDALLWLTAKRKGALSSALLRAKRSLEVTAIATSNVLFLALGNAAGLDLPSF